MVDSSSRRRLLGDGIARAVVRVVSLASAVVLATAGAGCSNEPRFESPEQPLSGPPAKQAPKDSSCESPRVYYVVYASSRGPCAAVDGADGRWVPEPTFPDAPADVKDAICTYRWDSAVEGPPDKEALAVHVGPGQSFAPACGPSGQLPSRAKARTIPSLDTTGLAGSVGCDVCGIIRSERMWAILPEERVLVRQLGVRLSDGSTRFLEVETSLSPAVVVELPAAPTGTQYLEGQFAIY